MTYDAIVVGARCAGSIVGGQLARAGWKVLVVDKATFPSDTISTHFMFPNTLERLDSLGILERIHAKHSVPGLLLRWTILGHALLTDWTPVGSHATGICVRRISLDQILVEWAGDAGAELRTGSKVTGLIGAGTDEDPIRGVVLDDAEEVHARWVVGADGRASTVANLLGLEKQQGLAGEQAYLFAYWKGLPRRDIGTLDVKGRTGLMWQECEDGFHLMSVAGPPEITRGSNAQREKVYAEGIAAFPEVIDPGTIADAERVSDLVVVPETMMRGFFRRSDGPGWVLVGDAGHFKHPGTAQGISDAVEQAVYVAEALQDEDLSSYDEWRGKRSRGHYEWSFLYGSWPVPEVAHPYLAGLAADPEAMRDWADVFTRRNKPKDVDTPERLGRWFSAPAS